MEVSRYYLNYLWWLLEPLLMMGVFYVVFGLFMESAVPHYPAFLLVGLVTWNWFNRTTNNASNSLVNGCNLMNQLDIPKLFFPLQIFLQDFIKHLFVLVILIVFLLVYPTPVHKTWMILPILIIVQALLILSTATLTAAIIPFVPDLKFIINTGLLLMFFGSGIFYDIEDIRVIQYKEWMYSNPMAVIIKAYRDILIYGEWPNWGHMIYVISISIVLLAIALWIISRYQKIYPRIC